MSTYTRRQRVAAKIQLERRNDMTHDNTDVNPIPADPCAQVRAERDELLVKNAPDEEAVAKAQGGGVGTNFVANAYAGPWARKSRD